MARDIEKHKEQIGKFLNEIVITSKSYQEISEKNKKLILNIKEQEELFSNLMNEKLAEKTQFEQQRSLQDIKSKADKEIFRQQSTLLNELKAQEEISAQLNVILIFP